MERHRRRAKREVKWWRFLVGAVVLGVVGVGVWGIVSLVGGEEDVWEMERVREPIAEIIDENAGGVVSARVKEFVVRLEDDLAYEGYKVLRVVLPFQKTRQVDVYLEDRVEYYKLSIDRGSAVSAEDVARMVRYLNAKELMVGYVDVRVEGKAFYK